MLPVEHSCGYRDGYAWQHRRTLDRSAREKVSLALSLSAALAWVSFASAATTDWITVRNHLAESKAISRLGLFMISQRLASQAAVSSGSADSAKSA